MILSSMNTTPPNKTPTKQASSSKSYFYACQHILKKVLRSVASLAASLAAA